MTCSSSGAEAAGLGPEEVRTQVEKWTDEAKPYGPEWSAEVQSRALKALQGKKAYAALATELGQAADKALPADASLELRGNLVTLLARSARLAGKDDVAAEAESRVKEIDTKLDAEYHEKVPPFKPETYAGRAEGKGNRVVLMEIFTGAECPPCVAADVAFDALLEELQADRVHRPAAPPAHPRPRPPDQFRHHRPTDLLRLRRSGARPRPSSTARARAAVADRWQGAEGKYKDYRGVIEPALDVGEAGRHQAHRHPHRR